MDFPENPTGFPVRDSDFDVLPGFVNPTDGYGEVPFHWWVGGDKLTKERLLWQLEQIAPAKPSAIQIN